MSTITVSLLSLRYTKKSDFKMEQNALHSPLWEQMESFLLTSYMLKPKNMYIDNSFFLTDNFVLIIYNNVDFHNNAFAPHLCILFVYKVVQLSGYIIFLQIVSLLQFIIHIYSNMNQNLRVVKKLHTLSPRGPLSPAGPYTEDTNSMMMDVSVISNEQANHP